MSQDNVAICLIERVAKYLTSALGIGSQVCHIAKGLDSFFGVSTSSSLLNQSTMLTCVLRTAYDPY